MNYKYEQLTAGNSSKVRQKFIDNFVNVDHKLYVNYIKPLSANDIWIGFGHVMSYLWSCIKAEYKNIVTLPAVTDYLQTLEDKEIYVMFDILPKKHILPDGFDEGIRPAYTNLFSSDTVLKMRADEFLKILNHDMSANVLEQIFGEDMYAFDNSFEWFIATTHNVETERICFGFFNF